MFCACLKSRKVYFSGIILKRVFDFIALGKERLWKRFGKQDEFAFSFLCGIHVRLETDCGKIYALSTKREVKMAGYWPSSFLRFYGPRRSRGP